MTSNEDSDLKLLYMVGARKCVLAATYSLLEEAIYAFRFLYCRSLWGRTGASNSSS